MKRIVPLTIVLVIVGAFGATLWFLYQRSRDKPVRYQTATPKIMDIVAKTVATGALVPREEIEIKPRVSGVLSSVDIQPGQRVEKGQLIARIAIVPDVSNLHRAEAEVDAARISFDAAKRELSRHQGLFERQVISAAELERHRLTYQLREQELAAARNQLHIVRKGAAEKSRGDEDNTEVRSTVVGTALDVPVKPGASVIESNSFNPGTTIAVIADMSDMIFQGQVDESEVGRLREGMKLDIEIGALDSEVLGGTLEYIAPKGVPSEGVIQFEVRARLDPREGLNLRANYSANADIVLDRRTQVLTIDERLLQFDGEVRYVEVEVAEQTFERREVAVGLSDGIHIHIVSGLDADTRIRVP